MTPKTRKFIEAQMPELRDALRQYNSLGLRPHELLIYMLDSGLHVGSDSRPFIALFSIRDLRALAESRVSYMDFDTENGTSNDLNSGVQPPSVTVTERVVHRLRLKVPRYTALPTRTGKVTTVVECDGEVVTTILGGLHT